MMLLIGERINCAIDQHVANGVSLNLDRILSTVKWYQWSPISILSVATIN